MRQFISTVGAHQRAAGLWPPTAPSCDRCPHWWVEHRIWAVGKDAEIDCPQCGCLMVVRFEPQLVVEEFMP